MRRGDLDDAAEAALLHAGQRMADGVERGAEIDRQDLVPFLRREILDRRDELDAGIVDQHVDRAMLGFDRRHHLGDVLGLAHVGALKGDGHVEFLGHPGAQLLDLAGIAKPVEHDVVADLGERARDAEADAAGRAGDHRYSSVQPCQQSPC